MGATRKYRSLWKVRIDTAARLLEERAGTISEIAYGVGFKGVSDLARKFRAAYGMSPAEYRDRGGGTPDA